MAVIVLLPLKIEYSSLVEALKTQFPHEETVIGKLPATFFKGLDPCVSIGGLGKTQFALQTQYIIDRFPQKISALICVGSAGGVTPDIKRGDIIVSTQTIEHDFKTHFIKKPLPAFKGSESHIQKLKDAQIKNISLHFGIMASGDEDVFSTQRCEELHLATQAIAVAWEGAGAARACAFNQIPYVEVRGITDSPLEPMTDAPDFRENVKAISEKIAQVLVTLLKA